VSEYYEEAVIPHPNDERDAYQFLEFHGWWDESQKRPMHNIITISPDEGCSLKEAEDLYDKQIQHRAREGFKYAFSPNPFGDGPRVIKV
jgi:hypothetical protein